jgi:uncharacterized repeat protein (TIGR04138 family)
MSDVFDQLECMVRADGRYHPAAFAFLLAGLEQTAQSRFGPRDGEQSRHVTGQELSLGLRDAARERWGPLAPLVLRRWGIRRTRDFGEMVYFLIELGLLGKQSSDRLEDFDEVYAFETAFQAESEIRNLA